MYTFICSLQHILGQGIEKTLKTTEQTIQAVGHPNNMQEVVGLNPTGGIYIFAAIFEVT